MFGYNSVRLLGRTGSFNNPLYMLSENNNGYCL
jgi:hypothetical protein